MRNGLIKAASVAALVLAAASNGAAQVPAAVYNDVANDDAGGHQRSTAPGTVSNAFGHSTIIASPEPGVSVQGSITSNRAFQGDASVTYSFEYFGTGGAIPIDIAYNMGIDLGNGHIDDGVFNGSASVGLMVNGFGLDGYAIGNQGGAGVPSASGTLHDTIDADQVYQITIDASISGSANVGAGQTGSAFVDPIISIDSSFTGDPSSYSLVLSDGIGNQSATTPEPGTLWMLAVAGGAMGLTAFRKRR